MGVSNRDSKKSLETCCLKNRQKLLHSRKGANDKMSPQKPNPTYRAKLLKPKKNNTFLHFWKHENYYNRAQIKTFPKPRPSRLCNRTLQKLEVALFRKHEISTMNSIAKTLIHSGATTRALFQFSHIRFRNWGPWPLVSTHTPRQEQRTSCVDTGPNSLKLTTVTDNT